MRRLTLLLIPAALIAAETRYARLGEFEGKVEVQLTAADGWVDAARNLPLTECSWVRTGVSSRVEIELDEGSVWRLGPESQGELADYTRLSTGQRITLLTLDRGLAYFTGRAEGNDALMIAVPGAQLTLSRASRVRLEVEESWSRVSVLEGLVRFSSPAAEIDLRQGQATRVEPANRSRFFLDRELIALEGDKWSEARDKALAASPSAGHVIQRFGLHDLDAAGEWIQTEELGAVWKPKVEDGWVPYRAGRWRWYDGLGYTWISDEPWGWLPYHYGRWARREVLGWIWAPSKNAIFKPGEVYWLRGTSLAGWGPLAPGEQWSWSGPGSEAPRQFLNAWTTYAGFEQDARSIDPAGFTLRPREPLRVATFANALPSPAFPAGRLDAVRPLLNGARSTVVPMVDGATFVSGAATPVVVSNAATPVVVINPPPAAPPVIVVTEPAADPPPPEVVPYPVPVYTGMIAPAAPEPERRPSATAKAPAVPPAKNPSARPASSRTGQSRLTASHEKKFHDAREQQMATQAIAEVNSGRFDKALAGLDAWTQRYPGSEFREDRLYYYIVAFDGLRQPAKVVDAGRALLVSRADRGLDDQRQMILACYLTSVNLQKLPRVTMTQRSAGEAAARGLLESAAAYFTAGNRPPETSDADWTKARNELETTARNTIAWLKTHHGLPD
jgi:hypothetical protein